MPVKKSGHTIESLLGDSSSFTSMSPTERNYFIQLLQEEMQRREERAKPIQIRDIVPIEQWINSEYYIGPDCSSIYPFWKDFIVDVFREDRKPEEKITQIILGGCFTGDTKVSLLDGRELSFIELVNEYGCDKEFWVYSCDESGNIVPGKAHNARKTKINSELVEVTLDNGEVIRCTPDHKFLLRDNTYCRADMLEEGVSLMPLYREYSVMCKSDKGCPDGYERVYNPSEGAYKNRKVVSVKKLSYREDVYDIEVDEYHNFALSSGVFVHNSIGIGKSTVAEIIMMRKLYELSCWKNINSLFNLMSKTSIMFLYFSVNKTQAQRTGFGDLKHLFDRSPYFKENFRRNERLSDLLVFPEGLTFAYGSGSSDSIGMSVISTLMDEANFVGGHRDNGNAEKASEMYAGIVNRANSRFIVDGGVNHSLNILVSSATHESSVTERQIAASRNDKHTIVCAPSQWEVKPDKFSKNFFFVCKGTDYLEPHIIRSTDDVNNFRLSEGLKKENYVDGIEEYAKIEEEIQKLPNHLQDKFLRVPEDLRQGFEMNIMKSLQDMGGVSVASSGKLFSSVAVYNACVDKRFMHPFISESITISTGDRIEIKDFLRNDFRLKHPERPRFIHIDQSYRTDDTGISCVYIDEVVTDDGVRKPIFGVDFMIQINPPKPPKKIAIYKIRNFVVFLANVLGMKMGMVSYDIFNSEESRQILEEMGFPVKYQSVDRTDKAYLDLIEIMYEGRLRMYDYRVTRRELFNLVHDRARRKVDHPKTISSDDGSGITVGTKDVTDSLAGAIANAIQFKISDGAGEGRTLEDFLRANEMNTIFEPDSLTVEQMVDKQIDDMIEEMEVGLESGVISFF